MNLLLDANISWRLCSKLSNHFETIKHIDELKLGNPANDLQIWEWAKTNDFVIVTNDDDFFNLILSKGFPPKVILFRTGNQSNKYIADLIISKKPDIQQFLDTQSLGVLEIF